MEETFLDFPEREIASEFPPWNEKRYKVQWLKPGIARSKDLGPIVKN